MAQTIDAYLSVEFAGSQTPVYAVNNGFSAPWVGKNADAVFVIPYVHKHDRAVIAIGNLIAKSAWASNQVNIQIKSFAENGDWAIPSSFTAPAQTVTTWEEE